jgi:hypothetical protein
MKVADIQLYMNNLGEDEIVYTAVMDGYVGTGDLPQEALSNLPEVLANAILKRPQSIRTEDVALGEHFLCEPDMRLSDWIEINKGGLKYV